MDASSKAVQQFFYEIPNFFINLQNIRESGELCDVTLNVDDHTFVAHRIVLAASIPYFRGMFLSGMKESGNKIIKLYNIDPLALKTFIDFAYTGGILITESNVDRLLMGAAYFSLDEVQDACVKFLKTKINMENVFRLKELADMLNLTELEMHINKFFQISFNKICNTNEFSNFSFDSVKSLLSEDELNVCSEEEVMDALIRWIRADDINRSKYIDDLLPLVRLHLVSLEYLTKHVASISIIRNSIPCRDVLDEARDYHLVLDNPSNRFNDVQPRYNNKMKINKTENVFILHENIALIYDVSKDQCRETEPRPKCRDVFGFTEYKNKVYVIGGYDTMSEEKCRIIDIYDFAGKRWSTVQARLGNRMHFGVTTLNDHLYICGGMTCENGQWVHVDSVEKYCPETGTCQRMQSMRNKLSDQRAISLQGSIYVIGGWNSNGSQNMVERYDHRTDTWTQVASMNERRECEGAVVINGKLYVFGNGGEDCSAEMYDPRSNKWQYIASMKQPMLGLFVYEGKVWKYGRNGTAEIYDPEKNLWSVGKTNRLYPFKNRFHSCVMKQNIN